MAVPRECMTFVQRRCKIHDVDRHLFEFVSTLRTRGVYFQGTSEQSYHFRKHDLFSEY